MKPWTFWAYPSAGMPQTEAMASLLGLLLNIGLLYLTMGFRQFSHHYTEIHLALRLGDLPRARHLLAELRLAFGLLNDPEFLHAPYVEMNVKILELFEAGKLAEAAAALNDYLVHSERIVLAVYARRISDGGQPK